MLSTIKQQGIRGVTFPLDTHRLLCQWWGSGFTTTVRTVQSSTSRGFGLLIAYVLPGFTLLLGLAALSDPLHLWLMGPESSTLAVGGVLYITAASIVAGMILNALRWALLDTLHHATGLAKPRWNDALLADRLPAFERLVEDHFRHHQFYGNTALAALLGFVAWRISPSGALAPALWPELALLVLELTLVAASRDALRRYYRRTGVLLALAEEDAMTNGSHPKPADPKKPAGRPPKGTAPAKPGDKPRK